jgi:hypothetical protein
MLASDSQSDSDVIEGGASAFLLPAAAPAFFEVREPLGIACDRIESWVLQSGGSYFCILKFFF